MKYIVYVVLVLICLEEDIIWPIVVALLFL